jgi:putative copper resistance protein D
LILLAGFLDVFFRGAIFIGLALAIGGILFRAFVLDPTLPEAALRRCMGLVVLGALLVCVFQLLSLGVALATLADENGRWPILPLLATRSAQAGLARASFAFLLATAALDARANLRMGISRLVGLGGLILISGAWLVHGASRLEGPETLMTVTVLHQLATLAWAGGVLHLVAQWRLTCLGPKLPARFSRLAILSVAGLALTGTFLSFRYVGSMAGLAGTAYGTMLLTKIILTSAALTLGAANFLSFSPVLAEVEAGIGAIILMAAAALTGQPPSIDAVAQQASPAEVAHVFAPKRLQLLPAPLAKLNTPTGAPLDPFVQSTELDRIQSDFNHNISGIFVVLLGVAALLHGLARSRVTRHWPLLFFPFWLFLVLFAQPTGWPLGRRGFWESLLSAEVLQHRMGTLLVVALGVVEWRAQLGKPDSRRLGRAFPLLCFAGGALLLSHSHSFLSDKGSYLIEISHNAIGVLAVLIGSLSWLELRAGARIARAAALLWPVCFMGVGWVLLAYQEA